MAFVVSNFNFVTLPLHKSVETSIIRGLSGVQKVKLKEIFKVNFSR